MAATTKLTPFGAYLRKLRKDHHLTLERVGEMTGKNLADVQKIETGKRLPDSDFVVALVNGLTRSGVRIDLNVVLKKAELQPIEGGTVIGGQPLPLSFDADTSSTGDENDRFDRRQWIVQQLRAALRDPTIDDETLEILSGAIVALRKAVENSSSPKRPGQNRVSESNHRTARSAAQNHPAAA